MANSHLGQARRSDDAPALPAHGAAAPQADQTARAGVALDVEYFKSLANARIATRSGRWFSPLSPRAEDINICDIAHALAMICRYTGHVSQFWSVAAHSIEVSHLIEAKGGTFTEQLTGLLHDASEAYLVDVPRPIKPHFPKYREWEAAIEQKVAEVFRLPFPFPKIVKEADDALLLREIANFFDGGIMFERYQITSPRHDLRSLDPEQGRVAFLRRYEELSYMRDRYER